MKQLISYLEKPKKIEDIIGQKHLIGKNKIISKMIENNFIFSSIFYGPPGIGKTSICISICESLNLSYKIFNPTNDKKNLLDEIIALSNLSDKNYVLIIDEIHRMNKDKQDILLNALEKGKLILFGTTTENPYYVINPAIRSRCKLIEMYQLTFEEIKEGLKKIIEKNNININEDAIEKIINKNNGDYRSSINLLNILWNYKDQSKITDEDVNNMPFNNNSKYSRYGDEIHNLKSALQKSIRGSDPNAAIYWLARLLESSDIDTICRRILVCSYEDVGLANPQLLSRVYAATESAKQVGLPEAKYILSYIVLDITLSPKSNSSTIAIQEAIEDIKNNKIYEVPENIKHNNNSYKYPHSFKNGWVDQNYLPKELKNKKYYIPSNHSKIELKIDEYWNSIKQKR